MEGLGKKEVLTQVALLVALADASTAGLGGKAAKALTTFDNADRASGDILNWMLDCTSDPTYFLKQLALDGNNCEFEEAGLKGSVGFSDCEYLGTLGSMRFHCRGLKIEPKRAFAMAEDKPGADARLIRQKSMVAQYPMGASMSRKQLLKHAIQLRTAAHFLTASQGAEVLEFAESIYLGIVIEKLKLNPAAKLRDLIDLLDVFALFEPFDDNENVFSVDGRVEENLRDDPDLETELLPRLREAADRHPVMFANVVGALGEIGESKHEILAYVPICRQAGLASLSRHLVRGVPPDARKGFAAATRKLFEDPGRASRYEIALASGCASGVDANRAAFDVLKEEILANLNPERPPAFVMSRLASLACSETGDSLRIANFYLAAMERLGPAYKAKQYWSVATVLEHAGKLQEALACLTEAKPPHPENTSTSSSKDVAIAFLAKRQNSLWDEHRQEKIKRLGQLIAAGGSPPKA